MADYALPGADETDAQTSKPLVESGNDTTKPNEPEPNVPVKPADCLSYVRGNPMERWPFLVFWAVSIFAIVMLIVIIISMAQKANAVSSFIILGVVEILVFVWAARNFRISLELRKQVNHFANLNGQFKRENAQMRQEVDKLGRANEELRDTENRLKVCNERMEENVQKFATLQSNLSQLTGGNIEGMKDLAAKAERMTGSWRESLIKNEKSLFMKIFDEMELKDGDADMSEEEFNQFLAALPEDYALLFTSMGKTWTEISGDDNMMQFEEFESICDEVVEARVNEKMGAEEE